MSRDVLLTAMRNRSILVHNFMIACLLLLDEFRLNVRMFSQNDEIADDEDLLWDVSVLSTRDPPNHCLPHLTGVLTEPCQIIRRDL